jgi:hypothetical protein
MEMLEQRLMMTVSQDANGWTVVTEPAGSKVIYVSSSTGNDSNNGLSPNSPVASLTVAQADAKTDGASEILLQSGDLFTESSTNNLSSWNLSGASAQNPFVLSYYYNVNGANYGTGGRPMIYAGTTGVAMELLLGASVNNLDVLGIQFDANLRDPTLGTVNPIAGEDKGFEIASPDTNILLEDCSFSYFGNGGGDNIDIEGGSSGGFASNITIRRCVVDNAWDQTIPTTTNASGGVIKGSLGKCEGMYCYDVNNLTLSQDTFDHNGWNSTYLYLGAEDIGYNHDVYLASTTTNVTVTQCIFADAAYAGLMARGGGTINYNLFVNDAVGCSFGDADGANSTVGGVSGSLIGNVVVGDRPSGQIYYSGSSTSPFNANDYILGAGTAFGQGFVIANTAPGAGVVVSQNIFTQDSQKAKPAITLTMATGTYNPASAVGINDLTITNNIMNGFRQGIQTDGRFVPGGTGLYALNGLTLSDNDYINNSTQEIRHDGAFAASQESWSGDHFYDPGLAQSAWITTNNNQTAIPFATWVANYDIGAKVYATLPYADPTRSAATYDAVLGGVGTVSDFIAQATQLSITNFRPVYMAQAAISYIDAGFNIVSGGTTITGGSSGGGSSSGYEPVTATATTSQVNASSLGATTYTFTIDYSVNYLYQFGLNTAALGNTNLMVTGPAGFNQMATFVSSATPYVDSNGFQQTIATYRITAPGGAWAKGADGNYVITLLPYQVLVSSGGYAQDGVVGSFNVDLTPPVANAVISNITTSNTFTVTYSDASGIDPSTLNSFEVQVTGPSGSLYAQYATLTNSSFSAGANIVTCTYSINPPGGNWATATAGTYNVNLLGGTVADIAGNPVSSTTTTLASFNVGSAVNTTASISGMIFNDANGNGSLDPRELPLTGVTVFIDLAGTGVYVPTDPSAVTDSNGNYTISGLAPGRYTVVESIPTGYVATSPGTGYAVVTLSAGQTTTGINFGDQQNLNIVNGGTGGSTAGTGSTGSGSTGSGSSGTGGSKTGKPVSGPIGGGSISKTGSTTQPVAVRFGFGFGF